MIVGHGGNIYKLALRLGCTPFEILDMSSNVNPLGPPPGLINLLEKSLNGITALPEADAGRIVEAFARRYDINPDRVLAGNGSTQFIYTLPQALAIRRALILGPTYADYADACLMHDVDHTYAMAQEPRLFQPDMNAMEREIEDCDAVFVCNPNNPTGALIPADELKNICRSYPRTTFIVDESYLPFVTHGDQESMIGSDLSNLIVLNSMSKIFRIPGLRIGFLVGSERLINRLMRYVLPWSVNSLAQVAVLYLMAQATAVAAFIESTQEFLEAERKWFTQHLEEASALQLFPSCTSFLLARLPENHRAADICSRLSQERILIRDCSNFKGLSERFIRISLRTHDSNQLLAERLLSLLEA